MLLTSDCVRGVSHKTYNGNLEVINEAYFSGTIRDNIFYGSFCPPSSGNYRLVYDGSLDSGNERYSSYSFNDYSSKNRTSEYSYLYKKTCYKYHVWHAYNSGALTGSLYFQKESAEMQLITNKTSYSCGRKICSHKNKDPQCAAYRIEEYKTVDWSNQNRHVFMIIFILSLVLA